MINANLSDGWMDGLIFFKIQEKNLHFEHNYMKFEKKQKL